MLTVTGEGTRWGPSEGHKKGEHYFNLWPHCVSELVYVKNKCKSKPKPQHTGEAELDHCGNRIGTLVGDS